MNITEFMSFDLEWFTTLPGLLITGGVIVLLIALIIFIISNKKTEKKSTDEVVPNTVPQEVPVADNTSAIESSQVPANAQMGPMPVENSIPVNNATPMEFSTPISNGYNAAAINNVMGINAAPVANEPVSTETFSANSVNNIEIPTVEEPKVVEPVNNVSPITNNVIDFSAPMTPSVPTVEPVVTPTVAPVAEQTATPFTGVNPVVNEPKVVIETPVVPTTPVVEEKPMIYGGVNPVNTITNNNEEVKPVIYGGANPLENTTTLPRMTNHEAYGANLNNVNVVPSTPVVEPTPVVTNVEPVMPTVESSAIQTPFVAPTMPVTGAEMFGASTPFDNNNSEPSSSSSEIETLEF